VNLVQQSAGERPSACIHASCGGADTPKRCRKLYDTANQVGSIASDDQSSPDEVVGQISAEIEPGATQYCREIPMWPGCRATEDHRDVGSRAKNRDQPEVFGWSSTVAEVCLYLAAAMSQIRAYEAPP
jgi:hypothetical protein